MAFHFLRNFLKHDDVFNSVYQELRNIAQRHMSHELRAHTVQPTAVVNEAYLKLRENSRLTWKSRSHFVAIASRAMKQVLIDLARRRNAKKRAGIYVDITLSSFAQTNDVSPEDFISLYEALEKLSSDPDHGARRAQLVEAVWLLGMDIKEVAQNLGISNRTAQRDWQYARVWLARELTK
jgi:RNA polymerase sigma factor (TIGR02999 family)